VEFDADGKPYIASATPALGPVLMDATIVRTILVPASMRLLGDWNWYLPRWLEWLPKLRVEGARSRAHGMRWRVRSRRRCGGANR